MKIFVNDKNEIKDVGVTQDKTLTALNILDDGHNPFSGWTKAKICCYRVEVKNGRVVLMTPYVDKHIIEHIDSLGEQSDENQESINLTQDALCESTVETEKRLSDIEDAICALSESM